MNAPFAPSRRDLLGGIGAMIVGFRLATGGAASAADTVRVGGDMKALDTWLAIGTDNRAVLAVGKCELGQGTVTGLLQIAAEELDLGMDQIAPAITDTSISPDQGSTGRSAGIEEGGAQTRLAAAEVRAALMAMAAKRLGAPVEQLAVERGVVSVAGDPARRVSYGDLIGGQRFELAFSGKAKPKARADYKLVGTRAARQDIPLKVDGRRDFMQYQRLPGMIHGRVVRPQGQPAYGGKHRLVSVDEASIAGIPGAQVVRKRDFLGVIAPREWDAIKAAQQLKAEWAIVDTMPGNAGLHDKMRNGPASTTMIVERGDVARAAEGAAHVVAASYRTPYQSHAPFAPNCAIADVRGDKALVLCSSHHPFDTPAIVARSIGLKSDAVTVQYHEGSGTYGRSNFDDVAQAAAMMSQAVGKPVRVQLMRGDEIGWDAYGPAHVSDVRVAADAAGRLVSFEYDGWQHGWASIEAPEKAANDTPVPDVPKANRPTQVNHSNVGAMYDVANMALRNHHLSVLGGYPMASALRSPMDIAQSFGSEQAIDALARACGLDPVAFRRRNVTDPRWRGVLEAVVQASHWTPAPIGGRGTAKLMRGRGVAMGTHFVSYGAAVSEVEVDPKTGVVVVKHVWAALDAGFAINPGLIENQIIGMSTQASSRMLKEEVQFSPQMVTSQDWESYPVLRFAEHPEVTPIVVHQPGKPSTGAGEEAMCAVAASIANAFHDATGVRMHQYPFTPERVLAALRAAKGGRKA